MTTVRWEPKGIGRRCTGCRRTSKQFPETTPNATFRLAARVVVRRRKRTILQTSQRQYRRVTNAISTARRFREYLDRPDTTGYRQVADHFDVTKATVSHYLSLLRFLPSDFVEWLGTCDHPVVLSQFNERRLRSLLQLQRTSQLEALKSIADRPSKHLDEDSSVISDLRSLLGQTP